MSMEDAPKRTWPQPLTHEQRVASFWAKVAVGEPEDCWEWTASCRNGYGQFCINVGRSVSVVAHRFCWELHNGQIPEGLFVLHSCDNRPCVNPAHLWLGTNADNMLDMYRKGRRRALRGENHPKAKLTPAIVLEIRARADRGESLAPLAKPLGISKVSLYNIAHRRTWRHVE